MSWNHDATACGVKASLQLACDAEHVRVPILLV